MAWIAIVFMGLVLGMLGGGGGILTVPILVVFFGMEAKAATGASLLVVGAVSLVGAIQGIVKGTADLKSGILLAIPSSVGALLARAVLVPNIPAVLFGVNSDRVLLGAFALLMLAVATRMIIPQPESEPKERGLGLVIAVGFVVGLLSGTLGAGGGFLILPALTLLLGVEMKRAVATSLVVITIQSLIGFTGELTRPQPWGLLGSVILVALLGLVAGLLVRERVPRRTLQIGFAILVTSVAVWMLIKIL